MSGESCCCPSGSWPALITDYVPKFSHQEVGGLRCYVAESDTKKAFILIPDIFGIKSGRQNAIADTFSAKGFTVVCPDLFRGNDYPMEDFPQLNEKLPPWARLFPREKVNEDMKNIVAAMKEKGFNEFYFGGFCWGCWAMFCYLAEADETVKGGVCFHPSLQLEPWVFGGTIAALTEAVTKPVLMLPAGNDIPSFKEGGEVINILKTKPFADLCSVKEFPDMEHGWVNRGDLSVEAVSRDVKGALEAALEFFSKL